MNALRNYHIHNSIYSHPKSFFTVVNNCSSIRRLSSLQQIIGRGYNNKNTLMNIDSKPSIGGPKIASFMSTSTESGEMKQIQENKSDENISIVQENEADENISVVQKNLSIDNINPNALNVEYAVRGPIVQRAVEIQDELNKCVPKPFKKIIRANIGDSHATGQTPITFFRQVLTACTYPELAESSPTVNGDALFKAKQILDSCKGSIGCYSDSEGIPLVREQVARYIENRDGHPSNPKDIFITNGASSAVRLIIYLLMNEKKSASPDSAPIKSGVMVPIPQYPLYSATISEFNGQLVPYYLDEETNWSLKLENLEKSLSDVNRNSCNPRAIVVINPGNPTGQILTYENIQQIIEFAHRHKLLIMADEVYQENIHDTNASFYSFKQVMFDMGAPYSQMELVSFHSISKGYYGECGLRGGYMELVNFDPNVKAQVTKLMSAQLGSTTAGQVILSCVVDPPKLNDVSYPQFYTQKNIVLTNLRNKANMVYKRLNEIEGISCNKVSGAMYAFPRLHLSQSAIDAAHKLGMEPDAMYCMNLLECTGVCVVPGSGFKQYPGTYHFRTTILPDKKEMSLMLNAISDFNTMWRERYPDN